MKTSCMIVDDEPFAVNLLAEYVSQVPYLQLSHQCYNAIEALDYLKSNKVDLIFLDINMPHLSGMQLATLFSTEQLFIFTTAYSEFAAESYEKNAVDYLLKPITFDRFLKSVNKAVKLRQQPALKDEDDKNIFIKTGRTIIQLGYEEVLYIEGLKDYVVVHTADAKHIVYKRMKDLEETLPAFFSRVHLSYIVNRKHIKKIEDNHILVGNAKIPVSEKYREAFLQKINSRLL